MVVSTEFPRLSTYLRAHFQPGASTSAETDALERMELLKRKIKDRSQSHNNEGNCDGLSWSIFAGSCASRNDVQTKELKRQYTLFMNKCRALLGPQSTPEDLSACARLTYDELFDILDQQREEDDDEKVPGQESVKATPEQLKKAFGSLISPKDVRELYNLVSVLGEWRASVLHQGSLPRKGDNVAFGDDIQLQEDPGQAALPFQESSNVVVPSGTALINQSVAEVKAKQSERVPEAPASSSAAAGPVTQPLQQRLDLNWLEEECQVHIAKGREGYEDTSGFTPSELAATIMAVLRSNKGDDALQNELFEMLGYESFEFIEKLIRGRPQLIVAKHTASASGPAPAPLLPGQQFRVQTERELENQRARNREVKRQQRRQGSGNGGDGDDERSWLTEVGMDAAYLRQQRELGLRDPVKPAPRPALQQRAGVVTANMGSIDASAKMAFPEGTVRKKHKTHEEVIIPAAQKKVVPRTDLVPISEFDDWAQLAFKGITHLNPMQSQVYQAAYHSNENLLLCAPTGAGKTNVAMMTILHEIGNHFKRGIIRKDEFKIIYVAPMKALAAEMVRNFGGRLAPLGITVKELTGDMQMTKTEIQQTQMIVTTPEKWDVVTRKSTDTALAQLVRLLIIDEVHLLHEERGSVIETLVARTLRQVEATQSMIRIVGLSATLPNYADVGAFLRVNPERGLFYFDGSYRPVPLDTQFIGVTENHPMRRVQVMNDIAFDKITDAAKRDKQSMIFVHSRKDTSKTARRMVEILQERNMLTLFSPIEHPKYSFYAREVAKSKNRDLKELFPYGFGCHHAGMLRSDRNLVERLFADGVIRTLCCTATLAWGVNLPGNTVIIKGTQLYDAKAGRFIDLGILDVLQVFGRAGRPQFDNQGTGIIITSHDRLNHYLALMNRQIPIESQFIHKLPDNLNAEIVLGTVTNVKEAITWLSYTYLYVRMLRNPMNYGISYAEKEDDPLLYKRRKDLIENAAKRLDSVRMLRFDERTGNMFITDPGRIASHYYLQNDSVETYNGLMKPTMTDEDVMHMICCSHEFENVMVREDELQELEKLLKSSCPIPVKGGVEEQYGKCNILLQAYISQAKIEGFSLISDTNYIVQSAGRIVRGLFEIVLRKGWVQMTDKLLAMAKVIDLRLWPFHHALRQFPVLSPEILTKLEQRGATMDKLFDMEASEMGHLVHHVRKGDLIRKLVDQFPSLHMEATVQPITRTVLRVQVTITADFTWSDRFHGSVMPWWIWVEDAENEHIYHHEYFLLHKKQRNEEIKINFTIPIFEPLPPQYFLHAVSDRWLQAETLVELSFQHLILPEMHPPHTELLNLQPLPVTAIRNKQQEALYPFSHFNPVQTQCFFTMVHTDENVLLGAPTGSGKTIGAELAMLRVFNERPRSKIVYIAPLKALVRERMSDWKVKFHQKLRKKVVELTGDVSPDARALQASDIVLTTPEKWDGISRDWKRRSYVKAVSLVIIDEIHLLGQDRGPILEVIVSRMRYIASQTDMPIRIVGLSTALANAHDLADWIGIPQEGLFNFRPSVRPVPLEVHISGYPGKHYCPRMATMNKPTYAAITTHSPEKPVLVFVASRRQTRLTALDLISYCAADENPRRFLRDVSESDMEMILSGIKDNNLKHTLQFGIGLHHAGLADTDRRTCEELFANNKIQVLVATSTLAWGVNLPAHLVVIKGTEYFDGKLKRYVDFPITDVLQMMGRAGRPQYDNHGVASILVHEPKKDFYKKFLYEPFPVESSLHEFLHDHLNAEICGGTIASIQDAIDYLTWTYFYRRILMNPSYYGLEDTSFEGINAYLSHMVEKALDDLERAGCVVVADGEIEPQTMGHIASYYYLRYKTVAIFATDIQEDSSIPDLLQVLTDTAEYEELPVRHNEDRLNAELARDLPLPVEAGSFESPHVKAYLLLQAHMSRVPLPITDYVTDTKSVLEQAVRILQAMVDVAGDNGWLDTTLKIMHIFQCLMQAQWLSTPTLCQLPHIETQVVSALGKQGVHGLPELVSMSPDQMIKALNATGYLNRKQVNDVVGVASTLPLLDVHATLPTQGDNRGTLVPGGTSSVNVTLRRVSKPRKSAYLPRSPKDKDEGWWLILADESEGELLALKRITVQGKRPTRSRLEFPVPEMPGKYTVTVYVISDVIIGLDQVVKVPLVVEAE